MNFEKRSKKLIADLSRAKDSKITTALISSVPNLKYFFNYSGISFERFCGGLMSLETGKTALVIPALDKSKAENSIAEGVFAWTDSEGYSKALTDALRVVGAKGNFIGCEESITLSLMNSFKAVRPRAKFSSISQTISRLRVIKDEEELEAVRQSTKKLAVAYEQLPDLLKIGRKESDVAMDVRKILSDEDVYMEFCAVQSGGNGAIPHLETTSKKISRSDFIVVDISSIDDSGYYADFTRTYSMGSPSSEQRKVYDLVRDAQAAALEAIGEGIPARKVDQAARKVIGDGGYGDQFIHRAGHGLGLEVHEQPWITEENSERLKKGMVFTIEPGIYLPEKFGVRIEDNVAVTPGGAENFTKLDHKLIQI
jgi:Xaa-Pro dipeptidase